MKTRWGSTLMMCKGHLDIHDNIKDTQKSIIREQGAHSASSIELLSAEDTIIIKHFIKVLQNNEDVTALLGKSNSRFIPDVDIFTATIICSLIKFVDSSSQISSIVREVRDDIFKRLVALLNPFPIIGIILRVSSLLAPEHKGKNQSKYLLGDANPYDFTFDHTVKILYKLASFFIEEYGQQCAVQRRQ